MKTWWLAIVALLVALYDCEIGYTQPASRRLPEPELQGGASVWSVIAHRRSSRSFGARDLTDAELGQLLWAAQGQNDGHRTAPSAGALYPLTVRIADARGVWRYVPAEHALVHESPRDVRELVAVAALRQPSVRAAAVTIVISGDVAITANKYGPRSAARFVTLEAGHAAQNILLAATALDLAAVPVGAFVDAQLRGALALPERETPLYLLPVGAKP